MGLALGYMDESQILLIACALNAPLLTNLRPLLAYDHAHARKTAYEAD